MSDTKGKQPKTSRHIAEMRDNRAHDLLRLCSFSLSWRITCKGEHKPSRSGVWVDEGLPLVMTKDSKQTSYVAPARSWLGQSGQGLIDTMYLPLISTPPLPQHRKSLYPYPRKPSIYLMARLLPPCATFPVSRLGDPQDLRTAVPTATLAYT